MGNLGRTCLETVSLATVSASRSRGKQKLAILASSTSGMFRAASCRSLTDGNIHIDNDARRGQCWIRYTQDISLWMIG